MLTIVDVQSLTGAGIPEQIIFQKEELTDSVEVPRIAETLEMLE